MRLVALGLAALLPGTAPAQRGPTRVILLVADGAGAGHWGLASHVMARLAVADFPVAGLTQVRGADHVVTESAQGGSALATGVLSFYGALGRATGIVTTTSWLDATPAAFVAHSPRRRAWSRLLEGYLAVRPTVVPAGGRRALDRTQAHHHEPLPVLAAEMRAFDEAIHAALRYQVRHPETLIVVTSDHETGGLALTRARDSLQVSYHTLDHTAEWLPRFARGPGAERFGGLLTNAEVGQRLIDAVRAEPRAATHENE